MLRGGDAACADNPAPSPSAGAARETSCARAHLQDARGLPAGSAPPHPRIFMRGAPCTRERRATAARPRALSDAESDAFVTADAEQLSAAASSDRGHDSESAYREHGRLDSRCGRCGRCQTLDRPSGGLGSAAGAPAPSGSAWCGVHEPACHAGAPEHGVELWPRGQGRMYEGHTAARAAGPSGVWQRPEEGNRCDRHGSRAGSRARAARTPGAAPRSREDMRVLLWELQAGMAALAPSLP